MPQAYRQDPETGEWVPYDPDAYKKEAARQAQSSTPPAVRRKELEEYAATIDQLGDTARESLETVLMADLRDFDPNMPDKDWKELRELLIEDLYQTRLYWSDSAGLAATEFYDKIITNRNETGRFNPAQLPDQVSRKMCADAVRALAHYLFNGRADKFVEKVLENAVNGVRGYANRTIVMNARRDGFKGVRYARVPTGPETCAFCMMLASRGFVYASEESAGQDEHFHSHCDCRIVPGFDGDVIEGYDSKVYLEMYKNSNRGLGLNDTLNNMRRDILYPVYKDHINEVKRDWWARNKDEQNAKRRAKKQGASV